MSDHSLQSLVVQSLFICLFVSLTIEADLSPSSILSDWSGGGRGRRVGEREGWREGIREEGGGRERVREVSLAFSRPHQYCW